MASMDLLSYENPVFRGFITWGGLLLWKMMFMAPMTGLQRFRTKAYENPEDVGASGIIRKDEAVERVRRAHLNDLETIPAFLFAAFAYVLTDPHPTVALWLIRVAVIARIFHTIVYAVYPIRQPARGISFGITALITVFMVVWSMVYFFKF